MSDNRSALEDRPWSDPNTEPFLKIRNISKKFGDFLAVDDVTLDIYRDLRNRYGHVGAVIQACLRRSEADVTSLLEAGPTDLRLCKGIYIEPEAIAYRDPDEIRESFNRLLELLLVDSQSRVGIATHDPALIDSATQMLDHLQVPRERYEFQMLLGVAGPLRRRLVAEGHPLRVYVPFGELWYSYSIRRLRENPNIAGHIIGNLFRRR